MWISYTFLGGCAWACHPWQLMTWEGHPVDDLLSMCWLCRYLNRWLTL